jgi:hypothetical protein
MTWRPHPCSAVSNGSYFDKSILILLVTVAAFALGLNTEGAALFCSITWRFDD